MIDVSVRKVSEVFYTTPDPLEKIAFAQQVKRMFTNAASEVCHPMGNLSPFMYAGPEFPGDAVNGGLAFEQLCEHPDFYLRSAESRVIQKSGKALPDFIGPYKTGVDMGTGLYPDKIFLIMEELRKAGCFPLGYVGVDMSRVYLQSVTKAMLDYTKNEAIFPVATLHSEFANIGNRLDRVDDPVFFLLGNTVSNFQSSPQLYNPDAMAFLAQFRNFMANPETGLVIGQDCNTDEKSLLKAYNNPAAENFMKNLLHRMVRDAHVTFDPPLDDDCSNWEYFARYNKEAHCMEMGVIAKCDHTITQGILKEELAFLKQVGGLPKNADGEDDESPRTYFIPKGRELHMWNSYKYPREMFVDILKKVGFLVVGSLFDPEDKLQRVALHLLRPDPNAGAVVAAPGAPMPGAPPAP